MVDDNEFVALVRAEHFTGGAAGGGAGGARATATAGLEQRAHPTGGYAGERRPTQKRASIEAGVTLTGRGVGVLQPLQRLGG